MSFEIVITGSARKMFERLAKARGDERKKLQAMVMRVFNREALIAAGFVVKTQLSGEGALRGRGGRFKQRKERRTGNLARSIEGRAVLTRGAPSLQVGILRGPALAYAGPQEFGTKKFNPESPYNTIRPKRGKYLAFPVSSKVLTPAGVSRYSGPRQFPEKLSPIIFHRPVGKNHNVAGMLVLDHQVRRAKERRALSGRNGRDGTTEAIYLLLTHMDIRPGFFLTDGLQAYLPKLVEALATAFASEFLGDEQAV